MKKHVKPEYSIGLKYQFFVLLARLLPCGVKNRIIGSMYGG